MAPGRKTPSPCVPDRVFFIPLMDAACDGQRFRRRRLVRRRDCGFPVPGAPRRAIASMARMIQGNVYEHPRPWRLWAEQHSEGRSRRPAPWANNQCRGAPDRPPGLTGCAPCRRHDFRRRAKWLGRERSAGSSPTRECGSGAQGDYQVRQSAASHWADPPAVMLVGQRDRGRNSRPGKDRPEKFEAGCRCMRSKFPA